MITVGDQMATTLADLFGNCSVITSVIFCWSVQVV